LAAHGGPTGWGSGWATRDGLLGLLGRWPAVGVCSIGQKGSLRQPSPSRGRLRTARSASGAAATGEVVMQKRSRPIPTAVLALAVATAALAAGCTSRAGSPAGTAGPPPGPTPHTVTTVPVPAPPTQTPPPRPPADRAPTAADSLAAFFAAARADDARIRAAARAVSRGIGPTSVSFSRATLDTVTASAPDRTARAIPPGTDPDLLRATLIVYADLATRSSALNPQLDFIDTSRSRPRTDPDVARFLDGLRHGSLVARAYPADLAAARALAATKPAIAPTRPDSRAAAELAIRIAVIKLGNACNGGNPPVLRQLAPIAWKTTTPDGRRHDGSIGGVAFHAAYTADSGWNAEIDAC
jgi:hypothetical protein